MASQVFIRDKMAYVFDSTAQNSAVLASQFKLSMASFQNVLRPVLGAAELKENKFGLESQGQFQRQKIIEHLVLYRADAAGLAPVDKLVLFPREIEAIEIDKTALDRLVKIAKVGGIAVVEFKLKARFFLYLQRMESNSAQGDAYVLAVYKMPDLYEAFATPGIFSSYLVTRSGEIAFAPKYWSQSRKSDRVEDSQVFRRALGNLAPQGVFDQTFANGKDVLISYAESGVGDYLAVSVVDKTLALQAFRNLLLKSLIFLLAVISAVVMIGMVASFNLTRVLSQLVEMTTEIAKGNFIFPSIIKANDEVGTLADNVVWMAKEVDRMFEVKTVQARMEAELEMVTTIQENLFPAHRKRLGDFQIESYFESATEAGGDWFHYSMVGDKLLLWIGDATGHGAPAALITAAAKATSAVLEDTFSDLSPGAMLKIMNHAIYETSKGSVMMTFFLAAIDIKTGAGRYANASHEFPFLIPRKENLKKSDLNFLCEARGMRLGENVVAKYEESDFQMNPGDSVVLFTDGLCELKSPGGDQLGERRFLTNVIKSASDRGSVEKIMRELRGQIAEFRGTADLVDDLMIIVCQYDPM